MDVEEQFKVLADEWEQHRQEIWYSSNINDYLKHPAYQEIVHLGKPAIPLIMERYKTDSLPWGFVLQEITGIPVIKDPKSFNPARVKEEWLKWWEQNKGLDWRNQ